jgi:hypothetical protein
MASIEESVDVVVLQRVVDWMDGIPDFKRGHASDSLFVAEGYLGDRKASDKDELFLLTLDVTFWYWIDDRTDESLHEQRSRVDWAALFASIDAGLAQPSTPEAVYLARMAAEIERRSPTRMDFDWWLTSATNTLRAFHAGEQISRTRHAPDFVDYLETGSWSSTVRNILATMSILYRMNWVNRRQNPDLADLERYLGLVARLENDAYGFEKERREGCLANAVLLVESYMTTARAAEFVVAQKAAYESLLGRGLARLSPADPFVQFTSAVLEAHRQWYHRRPPRYEQGAELQPSRGVGAEADAVGH